MEANSTDEFVFLIRRLRQAVNAFLKSHSNEPRLSILSTPVPRLESMHLGNRGSQPLGHSTVKIYKMFMLYIA